MLSLHDLPALNPAGFSASLSEYSVSIKSVIILPNSLLKLLVTEMAPQLSQFFLSPCVKIRVICAIFHSFEYYPFIYAHCE